MTQESFSENDGGLSRKQLLMVLEDVATYASTLHTLLMIAATAGNDWEREALINGAANTAQSIGAMADDAIGGDVLGGFRAWVHGPNFEKADAIEEATK